MGINNQEMYDEPCTLSNFSYLATKSQVLFLNDKNYRLRF